MSNMKDKSRRGHSKKKKERKDYFPVFKSVTYNAFDYLVRDYGFKHVETFVSLPECFIKYRNNTTYVTISYKLESGILLDDYLSDVSHAIFSILSEISHRARSDEQPEPNKAKSYA